MPKFRLKMPVDAEQYNGPISHANDAGPMPVAPPGTAWRHESGALEWVLVVEGAVRVQRGDWIVRRADGHSERMNDADLRELYEPVDLHAEPAPPISFDGVTQTPDMRFTIGPGCVTPEEPKPS